MRGFPFRCPHCHTASRKSDVKQYPQGKTFTRVVTYECGTQMFIQADPPKYKSQIVPGDSCKHTVLDDDK